jgi:hypothetical protein
VSKLTAGRTAAGCLTELANAHMIEVLWPRVNSGGGVVGKPVSLQGLKAGLIPGVQDTQVQPLIEGALASGTLAMQCRERDAFRRWTRSSRVRDVKASYAP